MTRRLDGRVRPAVLLAILGLALAAVACGGRRIPWFGDDPDAVLLVRHTDSRPLEIWLDGASIGFAPPGETTCFQEITSGGESFRLEARDVASGELARATSVILLPERPQLWDIDRNQVVDGRAHARGCE